MCRPSVVMLASVTRLLARVGGGGTHCNEIKLLWLK